MRFLHTGDWHVGKTLRGRSRASEHREVLAEIVEIARKERVDIALVAGDLFDTGAPTPESEAIVYRALLDLAEACAWVVVIAGNHDNPRRLAAVEPLMHLTNIRVLPSVARPEDGGVHLLQTSSGAARIAMLPFLSQRLIIKADALMRQDAFEHTGAYAERLQRIIEALTAAPPPPRTVDVLLAHAMVTGGLLGGGEREAHTIFEYSLPATAFPPSLHYVALGHLHRAQKLSGASPIWYAGSPLQLDFGETGDEKSVNLVGAEPGVPAKVTPIPLSAGRRLRRVRTTLEKLPELAAGAGDDYLRVEIDAAPAPGLADRVREILPNAVDVRLVERKSPEEKPRLPRRGRSPRELFSEYLSERGEDNALLLELFDELLEEIHASD